LTPRKKIICNSAPATDSPREGHHSAHSPRLKVTGNKSPGDIWSAKSGDAVALFADAIARQKILGWEAKYKDPETIIQSAWQCF